MLGHLAATDPSGVHAAAFIVTMIDTSEPSLVEVLATKHVRRTLNKDAAAGRIYKNKDLASNFAWMRPNDLIFNYVVNNWLMGEDPPAFDILAWNADSTNLTAALDRDFIELYADNAAATPGGLTVLGTPIDLSKVECDNYIVAGQTDHITPWKPCYLTEPTARRKQRGRGRLGPDTSRPSLIRPARRGPPITPDPPAAGTPAPGWPPRSDMTARGGRTGPSGLPHTQESPVPAPENLGSPKTIPPATPRGTLRARNIAPPNYPLPRRAFGPSSPSKSTATAGSSFRATSSRSRLLHP